MKAKVAFEVEAVGCYGQDMLVKVPASRRWITYQENGVDELFTVAWIKETSAAIRAEHERNPEFSPLNPRMNWAWIAEQLIADGTL